MPAKELLCIKAVLALPESHRSCSPATTGFTSLAQDTATAIATRFQSSISITATDLSISNSVAKAAKSMTDLAMANAQSTCSHSTKSGGRRESTFMTSSAARPEHLLVWQAPDSKAYPMVRVFCVGQRSGFSNGDRTAACAVLSRRGACVRWGCAPGGVSSAAATGRKYGLRVY